MLGERREHNIGKMVFEMGLLEELQGQTWKDMEVHIQCGKRIGCMEGKEEKG